MRIRLVLLIFIFSLTFMSFVFADMSIKEKRKITKKEVVVIAREYIRKIGEEEKHFLSKYKIKLKDGVWHVIFLQRSKEAGFFSIAVSTLIKINQYGGEIFGRDVIKGFYFPE